NMVRALVGTLVDVGRGKLTVDQFKDIIEKKNRCSAGQSMPGEALFLWDVKYDYIK
ncbi:MAG: tRNA pseudouridine(38-40) synthase TruA, partial [Muribaculaceae bacterium]|nr:tRNA pseudouridine(38-40) synthase TruA [Muribaculaceae bacterium]